MSKFFIWLKTKAVYLVLTVIITFIFFAMGTTISKRVFYPIKYKEEIFYYADLYNLDRALVLSVVNVESGFNNTAVSGKGAKGLMQLTDDTANYVGTLIGKKGYNAFDVKDNLNFGCYYLRYLIDKFDDVNLAIISFNAGEGRVKGWLKDENLSKDGKTLCFIPYAETENYIKKIDKSFVKYRKLYKNILDKKINLK